jgi:hypothetical protein
MTTNLIDEKTENAPGIPAENIYYYSDPLKAAYMAMVFHFRLRIENSYGSFMSFTDLPSNYADFTLRERVYVWAGI